MEITKDNIINLDSGEISLLEKEANDLKYNYNNYKISIEEYNKLFEDLLIKYSTICKDKINLNR